MARIVLLALLASCGGATQPAQPSTSTAPAHPKAPAPARSASGGLLRARVAEVTEQLFGRTIVDEYRWMETAGDELTTWLRAQAEHTDRVLRQSPERDKLLARLRELGRGTTGVGGLTYAGPWAFYQRLDAGEQLPKLVVRGRDGQDRVLVDAAKLGGAKGHGSIDNYAPSPDGSLVAVNVAEGGGEITVIRVYETATGRQLPDVVPRVWGEFPAAWLGDSKVFAYTQMLPSSQGPDPMLNQRVYLHELGTPIGQDRALLGRGVSEAIPLAPEEFPLLVAPIGSKWVIGQAVGARSQIRIYVTPLAGAREGQPIWTKVTGYEDEVEDVVVHAQDLYLLSTKDAPNRRILRVPAARPDLGAAKVVVAESNEVVVEGMRASRDALYVRDMVAGLARLRRIDYKTGKVKVIPLPAEGWVGTLVTDETRDGVTIPLGSWTSPGRYYIYDRAGKHRDAGLASTTTADFRNVVVERVEVPSVGGEQVPLTILRRSDLPLDGSQPAIVEGYGAYGIPETPYFSASRLAWIEGGRGMAIAHVRGGGTKGRRWTLGGKGANKKNGVADFIACGEYLVAKGYTSSSRMAATGASMGAILIGGVITERPDLFASAAIEVGVLNPLRILQAPNGANQKAELGDPSTEEGFRDILAMDPYHRLKKGTAYPAVLLQVGLNDNRVAPWMSAKFGARLQAATSSGRPVLLRVESDTGHGVGSTRDQWFATQADIWSFFLRDQRR